jgi:hypothetical protein
MSGASVKLISRRPRDYLEHLPKSRKISVITRIRRAYLRHFPRLAEDCAQEACARLIASNTDLRNGPEPPDAPNSKWHDQVEEALVRYATGAVMRQAVVKEMCAGKGLEPVDAGIFDTQEDSDDDLSPRRAGMVPHSSPGEQDWAEDQWHWTRVAALLRERLAQQPNVDPLVLQVFDQLCHNADAFERCQAQNSDAIPDIVRGESFQINHGPLLVSLQKSHPASAWDIKKLRLKIADLGRDAARVEESLASNGILLFEANRHSKGSLQSPGEREPERRQHDRAELDPTRGSLS